MSSPIFAWNIEERTNWYPEEEGDRRTPISSGIWSKVETLSRDKLEEIQLLRLQCLVRYAYQHSPFYRSLYQQAGVTPDDLRELKDIRKLPTVDKTLVDAAQEKFPLFGNLTTTGRDLIKLWSTTGTTGPARLWAYNREDWENIAYLYARSLYGAGVRQEDRFMNCANFPTSLGPWACNAGIDYLGAMAIPTGSYDTKKRMQKMFEWGITAFRATPSYTLHMADVAEEMGLNLTESQVRVIACVGEPLAAVPATKKLIEQRWQASVSDLLGITEVGGPVTFVCHEASREEMPAAHINEDYFLVEVLDPETGKVLGPGQEGELCITSLLLYGMPGIRYRTKDIVQVPEGLPCSCGRTTLRIRGAIKGRTSDMLVVKGINLYTSTLENILRTIPGLSREFQVILRTRGRFDEILLRVEPLPGLADQGQEIIETIVNKIKLAVGITIAVETALPGTLSGLGELGTNLKVKRVLDERQLT